MASHRTTTTETNGEILVAWQKYVACSSDEITLKEGDVVELLDTDDPVASKKPKLDPELDTVSGELLDSSAARHKLSVKPRRTHLSSRHSPTRLNLSARWLVREITGSKKQGWVPCKVLQTIDDPSPGGAGLPGDALFRRQAVVKELVETEQEFVKDLDFVVQKYLLLSESKNVPKVIRDNFDIIFGNLKEIAEFHRTVLMEGVKYYANEPHLLGKAFLRLERDFDKHVDYYMYEPQAQAFLDACDEAHDYFDDLSQRLGDDKTISEHLKLPIQRINDYQLLLKELVRYSACLGEDNSDLQKALELMLSVPHRAQDEKFTSNIEGYRGSIHKLGRLLAHDWFSVTFGQVTKERYLFLFKGKILICKVRRISEDRSVFQLKDIIQLNRVAVKEHPEEERVLELIDTSGGQALILTAHRDHITEYWLKEIREFAQEYEENEDTEAEAEDFQIASSSPPTDRSEEGDKFEETAPALQEDIVETPPPLEDRPVPKVLTPPPLLEEETSSKLKEESKETKQVESLPQVEESKPRQKEEPEKRKETGPQVVEDTKSRPKEEPEKNKHVVEESKPTPKEKPQKPKVVEEKQKETCPQVVENTRSKPKEEPDKTKQVVEESKPRAKEEPQKPKGVEEKQKETCPHVVEDTRSKPKEEPERTKQVVERTPKEEPKKSKPVEEKQHSRPEPKEETEIKNRPQIVEPAPPPEEKKDVPKRQPTPDKSRKSQEEKKVVPQLKVEEKKIKEEPQVQVEKKVSKAGEVSSVLTKSSVVNVETADDMSRRYTSSSSRAEGYSESSYSRRSQSSYSNDGSRYDSIASKYGSAESSIGGSKYESVGSKYDTGDSSYSRRSIRDMGDDNDYNYSRRSIKSVTAEYGDGDSYTRRSIRASAEATGDLDSYSVRKSLKTSAEILGYGGEEGKRSVSIEEVGDGGRYSRKALTARDNIEEELLSKYSPSKYLEDREHEDVYAKYERKYSRTDSSDSKSKYTAKLGGEEDSYTKSKYLSSSIEQKGAEEDVYAKYARKYSRTDSSKSREEDEDKYRKAYKRTDSAKSDRESSSIRSETTISNGKETRREVAASSESVSPSTMVKESSRSGKHVEESHVSGDEERNRFIKTIRGADIELTPEERLERAKTDKPEFVVKLKDTELAENTYLRFMVKVRGDPNPDVIFFKDGVIVEKSDRYEVIREHSDRGFYELLIPEVQMSDAGEYKCVASNKWGEDSCEATLKVTTEDLHKDMPEGEILPPGETPEFQWKKDGAPFEPDERFKVLMGDDEDSLALVFQHVRAEDVGLYTCVAQTSRGHISCSAELTVHGTVNQLVREPEKPVLIVEKRNPVVNAGGSAMIELQVKGFPKPQVKWTHEGKPIEAGGKYKFLYEDEETMSLVIKDVQKEDAGKYLCTAENEIGSDTAEMTLTVKTPPKLRKKIEDVDAHADLLLEIPVEIEGTPRPKVVFYKDGKEIKKDERIKVVEENEKVVLVIEKTMLKDSGSYSIVATNELAQISEFFNLHVHTKPKILEKLGKDKIVSQEEKFELRVKIESEPEAEVKWYKDDAEIKSSDHYVIKKDGETYILKITGAVTTDAARYKVKAVNIHGSVEDDIRVDVKKAPKITKGLQDMTVNEHDKQVTLDVKVEAFPKPSVKWYLDEMEITETKTEFTRVDSDDGVKLVIKEVNSELSGKYTCKLSNECGSTETSAKLTVNCAPRIIKQLKDTTVEEGATLHLEVEVEGCPTPTVKWLRNGREVSADARIKISRDTQRHETFNLAVNLIKYEEEGEYEVVVTNSMGTVSSKSYVTVHKVTHTDAIEVEEEPPMQLKVEVVEEESQQAELAQKEELEVGKEEAQTPEIEDVEKPAQGTIAEKIDIEEKQIKHSTPEPIIEEPLSPNIQRGHSDILEESEFVENDETDKVQHMKEEDLPKVKSKRAKSIHIEEIEENELSSEPKTPIETEVPKRKASKAQAATVEELEIIETLNETPQQLKESKFERQESQKGVREYEEEQDEEMEALLKRAQKQRSLVEELPQKGELDEAKPTITSSNMKDSSRPESLDICYIVKGTSNPPPKATWTINGQELKPDSRVRMTNKGEEFKLEIVKLKMDDAGKIECILKNPLGEARQTAMLEVTPEKELRRPKLKEGLKDQTIQKKNTLTFKAVVIGDPVPDATWSVDGHELTSEAFEKYKIILETEDHEIQDGLKECTYTLTIPRCERCNAGKYTFFAKNKWGECNSSAQLTVVLRPEIEGPQNVSVIPGEATELVCKIQANPQAEVHWTKDDQVVKETENLKIVSDVANETYRLVFKKALLSDEGYYKVVAKNSLGESSSEARLKAVTEKPTIITGLSDDQVEHTKEISVMVRADGLPKPQIRWLLNGKPIVEDEKHKIESHADAQVTSTLTVSDFNDSDSGIYKAIAANVQGEADTSARITMVQTPPTFGKKLERSEDVIEGEPLELKAKINGSPKPTVVWYKNGEPIDDERVKTSVLPDGTVKLNIEHARPSDSGAYKLVIQNPNGESACLCAVAVQQKPQRPKFLKCFKDVKLPIGETLRLEAQVQAHPPPEVKWIKDGVPVRVSSNIHFEVHPDGKVALIVDCAKPENAGKYELQVSNKYGDAMGEASVEIEKKPTKPEFLVRLVPQTVVEGFPVKFEVKAVGHPAPKLTWSRNGAEVISDNKHVKISELPDGTSVLLLDAANQARDGLTYRAIAINEAGEAETSAPLTVIPATNSESPEEKPMFLHPLKDVTADEGKSLVLSAPFTANPVPMVEWSKDGVPLSPSDRILVTCDGKKVGLEILNAVPSDAGRYSVKISNPLGEESSEANAAVHKVFMPPHFTQTFTDLQQLPGRDAKFPCRVSGVPQPEVVWTKDGLPIKESDKYHIKRDGDLCCLYVLNCSPDDAAVYRARAINKEGEEVCTASLEVVDQIQAKKKIEPPTFLKRIGDTELFKGMTAKFTACASGYPEPEVEWYHNDQKLFPSNRIKMETDPNGLLRLIISDLDEADLGKYSCKITNEYGGDICHANLNMDEGLETRAKRPITDQYTEFDKYKRTGAPVPLSDPPIISQMTDRHCTLSWKPSIPPGPRAPVTYQLEMCELPNGDWFTVRTGIRSCTCGVRNLEPFRDYKFRVRVENKYGISDPSPYALTHRAKLEPDLPKFRPWLPPEIDFRPETSPYFPKDFDIERPPHDNMAQAPRFLRQEHDTQYGVKDQNTNLFWFVYGYPKPKVSFYFNDELIESGGRFDMSYTRNGQATLFINKMLERDVGWYEAVATNEHGEARQRVRLEIAEMPQFIRRPEIQYAMHRGKVRFDARIVGVPYPEIKWYKDWKPLAASTRIKIQFIEPDTAVLVINDIITKDEGLYSVSARNVAGSISSSAMLHVEEHDHDYNLHTYRNLAQIKPKKKPLTDLYDLGDELGRGTQGVTYHAVARLNGRNYAAKVMHGRGELRPFMYNELEILNELRHRKLIGLHDCYEGDDTLALILELAAGGELVRDYLLKQEYYTERDIAGFIRQLLQGLEYMHDRGYGHMGLNIGDLLISHPGTDDLKITDFGLARRIHRDNLAPLKYGVPEFASPEAVNGEGTGFGQDMWSVGIITYILLSGRSPFRGNDDRETLKNVQAGKWIFDEDWWLNISVEAKDFISKLLVYQSEGRMDVHAALRHPWLERADKIYSDEYRISSKYLESYYRLFREWYDNASCKKWFRRRTLESAFTHPSRMVYPPGEYDSPRATPAPIKPPRLPTWEDQLPTRSPLNYEIGAIKSESHYQNGPDTYLLQLRDVDFPVRLREYMKVAGSRGPGVGYIVSNENGFDWHTPTIRERRRFTDIMDEEIDDERRARISRYGASDSSSATIRRLKHELGSRLDTYVEAEAYLESKQDGRLPFFREKPQMTAMVEGRDLELTCFAVGEPEPVIQWFKNDSIVAESHRVKIDTDEFGRSHLKFSPALSFDQGMYKVVARNKIGQTVARARIVFGSTPEEPDSPESDQSSDTEIFLTWKQPRFDGNSPVLCYSLEYKLADDIEWTKKADNIDHEFYLMRGLTPSSSYMFRLAARNAIGWSDFGVPSGMIKTKPVGAPRVQVSPAVVHLQQITDSGEPVEVQARTYPDYEAETHPVEWENENAQENYNFISEIAKGQFSTVLKAIDKRTDAVVVAKVLDLANSDDVEGEFAALRSLRHERIAGLIAAYKSSASPVAVFILEKLQGADVLTYLAAKHEYTEQTVATIVSQVLDGLQYLHWRGLCHLDLQPDNVVMAGVRSVQVKLVDLGAAHRVTKLGTKVPIVGHLDYMSPEVLNEEPAFPQTDIWTVGVLTYIMLSGVTPFKGVDENETKQNITFVRYRFEHLYKEITQESTRFLMLLFKRQPNKRPSAEECHENRWLLPTDYMIKKRERAVFLGNRLKEYSSEYHNEKAQKAQDITSKLGGKFSRSHSIQEELLTAP
ncbi:obscurin isoform X3 [Tribolium castaneum]|uniref:obscurin isoform X3 n=1 Tax=Tribolium castaneum TaxID=7070 RepID=UPI0030FE0219